jgi:CDP-4-dehydro-6-deoxyglucose reductase
MAVQNIQAVIQDKQVIAKETFLVRVVNPEGGVFDFQPGQFATLTVAPGVKRSYSIASMPGKDYIDFIADNKRGGPGSQWFTNCKVGDTVEMITPIGMFVYIESEKPAYFFGTGTGQVPFMSMVEYALTVLKTPRQLVIYSGFRYWEDVFGNELCELLDVQHENFKYILSLTQPAADWQGCTGRITQFVDTLPQTDIEAYVCGSKEMVAEVVDKLIAKGVPEVQIHHELFY